METIEMSVMTVDDDDYEVVDAKAREDIQKLSEEIANLPTKAEIVAEVLLALDTPIVGTIDENNVITLSGELEDGTYTLKYLNESEYAEIGTLVIGTGGSEPDVEEIKNWLPLATTTLGGTEVYDGDGWKVGTRWSNSSKAPTSSGDAICCVTGIVPVTAGDTVYTYGIPWEASGTTHPAYYIKYSSDGSIVSDVITSYGGVDANGVSSFEVPAGVTGVRFSGYNMSDASMITVNQYPIA